MNGNPHRRRPARAARRPPVAGRGAPAAQRRLRKELAGKVLTAVGVLLLLLSLVPFAKGPSVPRGVSLPELLERQAELQGRLEELDARIEQERRELDRAESELAQAKEKARRLEEDGEILRQQRIDLTRREGQLRKLEREVDDLEREYHELVREVDKGRPGSVAARVRPAVLMVRTERASGSGFVVAREGLAVTNYHVVEGSSSVAVRFPSREEPLPASVVAVSLDHDLAVLELPGDVPAEVAVGGGYPFLELQSQQPRVADTVLALGSPAVGPEVPEISVTDGIVSRLRPALDVGNLRSWLIQTDAAINPGNSGGPLVDKATGRAIGVVTLKVLGLEAVAFAVPAEKVEELLRNRHEEEFAVPGGKLRDWEKARGNLRSLALDRSVRLPGPVLRLAVSRDGTKLYCLMPGGVQEVLLGERRLGNAFFSDVTLIDMAVPPSESTHLVVVSRDARKAIRVDTRDLQAEGAVNLDLRLGSIECLTEEHFVVFPWFDLEDRQPARPRLLVAADFAAAGRQGRPLEDLPAGTFAAATNGKLLGALRMPAAGVLELSLLSQADVERIVRGERPRSGPTTCQFSLPLLLARGIVGVRLLPVGRDRIIFGRRVYRWNRSRSSLEQELEFQPPPAGRFAPGTLQAQAVDTIVSVSPDAKDALSGRHVYDIASGKVEARLPLESLVQAFSASGRDLFLVDLDSQNTVVLIQNWRQSELIQPVRSE